MSPQEITPQPTLEQTKSVLKKPETENNKEKISTTNLDNETLQALMKAKEEAILAAKNQNSRGLQNTTLSSIKYRNKYCI